jgi:hypothetical protein
VSIDVDLSPNEADAARDRPLVFISHRHEDKALADVIGAFVRSSSGGRLDVFQSSDATSQGPRSGAYLTDELKSALWHTSLMILVYTRPEADWSWCMLECGLALRPDTPDTGIKVLACGSSPPPQFQGRVLVKITDRADVQRFANEFLTDAGLFPGLGGQVAPGFAANDASVVAMADRLFEDMSAIELPQSESVEEWPAYPCLQIEIDAETAIALAGEMTNDERLNATLEALTGARIIAADSEGARIFGRREVQVGTTFGDLRRAWTDTFGDDNSWEKSLAHQIMKGVQWGWPNLRWELMRSIDDRDSTLYGPIVTRIRRWPTKRMLFDVYFAPFGLAEGGQTVRVNIPGDAQAPEDTDAPAKRVG